MQADIHASNLPSTGILASTLALSSGSNAVRVTETADCVQFVNESVNNELFEAIIHENENDKESAQMVHEVNEAEAKNKDSSQENVCEAGMKTRPQIAYLKAISLVHLWSIH